MAKTEIHNWRPARAPGGHLRQPLYPPEFDAIHQTDGQYLGSGPNRPFCPELGTVCFWTPGGISFLYFCIFTRVIHRSIQLINTRSVKCIHRLSACGCHGSSCGGRRESSQAVAPSVSFNINRLCQCSPFHTPPLTSSQ